ncbi:hypothetical protein HY227_02755 [Candidatus Wolfebacteria bacterium]|nr:hypothetical protein [Candidatus Wolfebacteria bacterium]
MQSCNSNKGAVAILGVLMLGGVIVEIALTGLFVVYYLGESGFGVKLSAEALAAAEAGIADAKIKIVRNKDIASSGVVTSTLTVGNRSAEIKICTKGYKTGTSECDTAATGKYEINSIGIASLKRRKLRAVLNVNSTTSEVQVESLQEVAL